MQKLRTDVWVGLFVMLGAAALVFLALQSANLLQLDFRSGYRVSARFDNIGGLKPQAAVRSAGVVVGAGSDLGGGASVMGTLSGGGTQVIRVGERCLVGANAGDLLANSCHRVIADCREWFAFGNQRNKEVAG